MINQLSLNWIEAWAVRFLTQSPRVGLLIIKGYRLPQIYVAIDRTDNVMPTEFRSEAEPAAHLLERLYHAPSHGEAE